MQLELLYFDPSKIPEYSKNSKKLFELASHIACLGVNQATKEAIIRDYELSTKAILKDVSLFLCGLLLGGIAAFAFTYIHFQNL